MPGNTLDIAQLEVMIRGEKDRLLGDWMKLEIYMLEIILVDIFQYSEENILKLNKYLSNTFFAANLQFTSRGEMTDVFYRNLMHWATLYFDKQYEIDKVHERGPDIMKSFAYVTRLLTAGPDRVKHFLMKQMGKIDSIGLLLNDLKNIEFELNLENDGNVAYHIFHHCRKKALEI